MSSFPEFDEEDEDDDGNRSGRARQAKYRYRWPEEVHDEVLARLLALNSDPTRQRNRLNLYRVQGFAMAKPQKRGKVNKTSEREPASVLRIQLWTQKQHPRKFVISWSKR